MEKQEQTKQETVVVEQLPQVQTRIVKDEQGSEFNLVTRDEALTEILAIVRELKKLMK